MPAFYSEWFMNRLREGHHGPIFPLKHKAKSPILRATKIEFLSIYVNLNYSREYIKSREMRRAGTLNFRDCIEFANKTQPVYFATIDGDRPRVRPVALQFADERGFYFQTEPVKAFYRQLKANNKVELCFYNAEGNGLGRVMRVSGEVEFCDDIELKAKLLEERPFLKSLGIEAPNDPMFVLLRLSRGEAFFWTMQNNMKESEIERIVFDCNP